MQSLAFPDPYVVNPISEHQRTIILLHGRGSNGSEFAQDLFESQLSSGLNLRDLLPNYKWIFPTCPLRYAAAFREQITQWYEISSLTDPGAEQENQVDGIHAALEYISVLVTQEAQVSPSGDVILGGISQGFSIAILVALISTKSLIALVGFSSWLPQASEVQTIALQDENHQMKRTKISQKLQETFLLAQGQTFPSDNLSVFLAHCADDSVVDIAHGRQVKDILISLGHEVNWFETTHGGHWINEPEGVDGLETFLRKERLLVR